MKTIVLFSIFATLFANSTSIPILERLRRSPQFMQNYAPGSQSQNFNCQFGGCGSIGGLQQIHGGLVSNYGSGFGQNYYGGSHATNLNMGRYGRSVRSKRSPRFFQSFASGSNSTSIPIVKRLRRSPQFLQNYAPGSQSQNFNCQFGGCGNIGGPQQIHGGYVSNYGSGFGQNYYGGSHATNLNMRYGRSLRSKRSPQFFQSFAPGSQNVNCPYGGCYQNQQVHPVHMSPGPFPVDSYVAGSLAILNPGPQLIMNPGHQMILNPGPQQILNSVPQQVLNPVPQRVLNPGSQQILNPVTQLVSNPGSQQILNPVPQQILNPAPQINVEDQTAGDTAAI